MRNQRYREEAERLSEILQEERGDLRIGQLMVAAVWQEIESESQRAEDVLFNIEDDRLLEHVETVIEDGVYTGKHRKEG